MKIKRCPVCGKAYDYDGIIRFFDTTTLNPELKKYVKQLGYEEVGRPYHICPICHGLYRYDPHQRKYVPCYGVKQEDETRIVWVNFEKRRLLKHESIMGALDNRSRMV